jgi:hypothetical protein
MNLCIRRKAVPKVFVLACVWMLFACTGSDSDELMRPEDKHILSRLQRGADGELIIAATYSGGGAGDTVYKFMACPANGASCEVLASIDSNDGPKPKIFSDGNRIILLVNKDDYIYDFASFSRLMSGLNPGRIYLHYR